MATNNVRWIRNLDGAMEPLVRRALFQAGATQAIKRGEILELTGNSSTAFVPIDSDFAMNSHIAIANEEIKSGDRAGYYEVIVPRPGDVFEYDLAAASAIALDTPLYFSSSEVVTVTAGGNILGRSVGLEHYPQKQGHLADDAAGDAGTTINSTAQVRMTFDAGASWWSKFVETQQMRTVEAHTAGDTLTVTESGSAHTTAGASGTVTFVMPAAVVGLEYFFKVGAAFELRIDPNGSETIALPSTGVQGAAGKYLTANAAGETVHILCSTAGAWDVYGFTGTWTAEG